MTPPRSLSKWPGGTHRASPARSSGLNLPSEAGTRYRRGADWGDNMPRALDRFCQLIAESGATVSPGTIDESGTTPDRTPLPVRVAKVNGLLGTDIDAATMGNHLSSIGFQVDDELRRREPLGHHPDVALGHRN